MKTAIYLNRKMKVIVNKGSDSVSNAQYVATMLKNFESLGFSFSKSLIDVLSHKTVDELKELYLEWLPVCKKMVGAHVRFAPMYPNFPEQVMSMGDFEFYMNAIIHYLTNGEILPEYAKDERLPLFISDEKFRIIDLGNEEDFNNIFTNLMASKTSLSEADKEDLTWFIKNTPNYESFMPATIPLKENVALIGELILSNSSISSVDGISKYFKTATDVLRLITMMSDGDISLAENTRYRSFKRRERRMLLTLLENCGNIEEDMLRYKNRWIRVGERLHPSEFKTYSKTIEAFKKLRNNVKIETFGGKLAASFENGDIQTALKLLSKRPGEFARKLDYMLRNTTDTKVVLNDFKKIAAEVSTPVLLQVKEHFVQRNNGSDIRAFFPKGNVAKAYAIENNLAEIDQKVCNAVVSICRAALIENYRKKDFLGNVYLSREFENFAVPQAQRSASKALKAATRGSRFDIPVGNTLRTFLWWKNGRDRTDIDLSMVFFNSNWEHLGEVSYYSRSNERMGVYHSGDITNAPNGACEFIDIDMAKAIKCGVRYAVMSMNSYTMQPYCDLPECFGGWMVREEVQSGEVFEPRTVHGKFDISSNTQICIPMIVDIVDREVIWTDMGLTRNPSFNNNVAANRGGIVATCKAITETFKPNLFDLISLHIEARGVACTSKEDADIIFDLEDSIASEDCTKKVITPYDIDVFMGEYI